jgi:hypothetical protein
MYYLFKYYIININNMKNIKNTFYEINYNNFEHQETSILLELYRGKLYNELINKFIYSSLKNFNEKIFSNKKKYYRTLVNLLSTWIFTQYSYYDFKNDAFFPNIKTNKFLKNTLYDYSTIDTIKDVHTKINNIIYNLNNNYNHILEKLNNYKKSDYYNKNKDILIIEKKIIKQKRDNLNIMFYKFIIKNNNFIVCNRLQTILNNIIIPIHKYNEMKNKFIGNKNMLDYYIWIILFRYQLLGSNNHQLAVLPNILKKMKHDLNYNFECFASAINSSSLNFCSLYYDVEKYFGSVGNFFNLDIKEGVYSFNPPYQSDIIERGVNKLLNFLDNTTKKLEFIITIPIWDIKGKEIMEKNNSENNNNNINYGDFEIINKVFTSKFFKGKIMISKNDFTYIDHNFCLFKNTTIQNTYVIVLANFKNNHFDIIKEYDYFSFNYDKTIIDL